MRNRFQILIGLTLSIGLLTSVAARAQNVAPGTLHSVVSIVATDPQTSKHVTLGSAFFVEVPSKAFSGSSFVYLITARHNLFDADGNPIAKPRISIEDARSGALREVPLPSADQWFSDPKDDSVDLAALPFAPAHANFTAIPIGRFINQGADTTIPVDSQLGAEAYYLNVMTGDLESRPVIATRFGRVSVAQPAASEVPSAGKQNLCFIEGAGAPQVSGAPVFLRNPDNAVLWGMVEATSDGSSGFSGLIGAIPAGAIAETVEAMAAAQEQKR
ncbi:MAG: hypothetical protein ABSD31_04385 [Candidatus Binataceae bacterium]